MNDPTSARQLYHRGNLREAVLVRAEQILDTSGVEALSLRGIARDLGVSHGAPGRHFPDRQGLLDALALQGFQRLGSDFDAAVSRTAGAEHASFADRIQVLARTYLRFATENPALLGLMFARKDSSTANADIAAAARHTFNTPLAVFAEAQRRGEIVAGETAAIGLAAMANLQGLASFVTSGLITTHRADELIGQFTNQLLLGLRPR
jgi:AcrR family transcriptional regulator